MLWWLVALTLTRTRGAPEENAVSVVFENYEKEDRELLWLNGPRGPVKLSRIPGRSAQELLTFVGHELGWRKAFGELEGKFVVEAQTRVVALLPRSPQFDAEVAAMDANWDHDVMAMNKTRFAYYVAEVPAVDEFLRKIQNGRSLRHVFQSNYAERLTTFGTRRRVEAIAFELDDVFVLVRQGPKFQGSVYLDLDGTYQSLPLTSYIPSPADLSDLTNLPLLLASSEDDHLQVKKRRRRKVRVLHVGCTTEATLLAVTYKQNATVHCVDPDLRARHLATTEARTLKTKLVTLCSVGSRRYDLITMRLDVEYDDEDSQLVTTRDNIDLPPVPAHRLFHDLRTSSANVSSSSFNQQTFLNESHRFLSDDGLLIVRSPSQRHLDMHFHNPHLRCDTTSDSLFRSAVLACRRTSPSSSPWSLRRFAWLRLPWWNGGAHPPRSHHSWAAFAPSL